MYNPNTLKSYKISQKLSPKHTARGVLTSNYLIETRMNLEELIPAAIVKYGLNRVQLPLWLQQQSLILSWAKVVSNHL